MSDITANILARISSLPPSEQEELLGLFQELEEANSKRQARDSFLPFVKYMWPSFIEGHHHKMIATLFDEVISGRKKRIIVNMPPRHTKSEFASIYLPAYFLGRYPEKKIIQASHTSELAVGFGRRVRSLVGSEKFSELFPNVSLSADSKAAGRWATNRGGEYFAIGVGGAVAGKGADLFVVDDPHSEQDQITAITNPEVFDKTLEWYEGGPRQRLQPGGAIIIVMCMTGDTPVLMADGSEISLCNVRPGDEIATYEDGAIKTSRVRNWQSNGFDDVFTVKTQSGKTLRANERHPFLVDDHGERRWIRLKDLKPGMALVSTRVATDPPDQKQNRVYAKHVSQENLTTGKIQTHHIEKLGTTESGKGRNAPAEILSTPRDCVPCAIQGNTKQESQPRNKTGPDVSRVGTESLLNSTRQWFQSAITGVMFVANDPLPGILAHTGGESFASTTATPPDGCAAYSVTTAISLSDMEKRPEYSFAPPSTYDVTLDVITEIKPSGRDEVFDIEVERTGNFIANGIVSHNTRWHIRDLTAQLIKRQQRNKGADKWEVIEFPAIMPSGNPVWPEYWKLEELLQTKNSIPVSKWNAQYQQNPTAEEGALIKREYWQDWDKPKPPKLEAILQSWDTAYTKDSRADYSAVTTWGVFVDEETEKNNLILLDAVRGKWEFPDLKEKAVKFYKQWEPDIVLVEARAAGHPLIYELRSAGIPIQDVTVGRGSKMNPNDKISRVNSITDIFASKFVWAPKDMVWAQEVIEECASFPAGDHDDLLDTVVMAVQRFRHGGWIGTVNDDDSEDKDYVPEVYEYY